MKNTEILPKISRDSVGSSEVGGESLFSRQEKSNFPNILEVIIEQPAYKRISRHHQNFVEKNTIMSGVGQSLGGSSTKEVNAASLCRMGQETVQDLVTETQDMFSNLKGVQLPNGRSNTQQSHQDKIAKLQDITKHIEVHFKKLRLLYDKCIQISSGVHTASGTHTPSEDLIMWKDVISSKDLIALGSREKAQYLNDERVHLIEQLQSKNGQLRQVMEQMRALMWDINTMLAMRHTSADIRQ